MMHQPMKAGKWAILRMAGPRTLLVVDALKAAGIDAWTPTAMAKRRRHRETKATMPYRIPIAPTFAFVPAEDLDAIRAALALPICPFPQFSIFQYAGTVPVIADRTLMGLREEEGDMADKWASDEKAAALRQAKDERDALRRRFDEGSAVNIDVPAFAGLTGVVEAGSRQWAHVNLGGGFRLKIDTWLLAEDRLGSIPA